jgi:beta-glucosidase/6-phospho-beta-glucosidase/beta-galactosidase
MGGFESSCQVNQLGRIDMIAATQHDRFVHEDYRRLRDFDMQTVRDTVRWHLVEAHPRRYDFSSLDGQIEAANDAGIQVIWDFCHYGWPDDIDLFAAEFVERFASFSRAVAEYLRSRTEIPLLVTPINEISFFSWASGESRWFYPYAKGKGPEIKRQLIRAAIAAIDEIRTVDPTARIVTAEPVIHVVPPAHKLDVGGVAAAYRGSQFEAWDMLAGTHAPELGGRADYLDVIGVNFYHDNQWEHPGGRKIHWHIHPRDPRWVPFHRLVAEVYERYRRPIFVAETSHVGVGRPAWIREMTDEVCKALKHGVPLEGVCLYPIVDRFEWTDPTHWHNSGLWDFDIEADGTYRRVLNVPYATELRACQEIVRATFDELRANQRPD